MCRLLPFLLFILPFQQADAQKPSSGKSSGNLICGILEPPGTQVSPSSKACFSSLSQRLVLPASKVNEKIINHLAYSLSFNYIHHQANWVAYELTGKRATPASRRGNQFRADPELPGATARNADYAHSGYDKGHLAPAADMSASPAIMKESFYYSNISPQLPSFNRGIWKKLEDQVRDWVKEDRTLYIVTGPVLVDSLNTIGLNHISVPKYFYKVLLNQEAGYFRGIAFVLPNAASSYSPEHFAVSIDSVERLTGIDFFPLLPDSLECPIEASISLADWAWRSAGSRLAKNRVSFVKSVGRTGNNASKARSVPRASLTGEKAAARQKKTSAKSSISKHSSSVTKAGNSRKQGGKSRESAVPKAEKLSHGQVQ